MVDRKGIPHMRKKLIALSIALLTIGGSLTFMSVASAEVPQTVVGLAAASNAAFIIIPDGSDALPVGTSLTHVDPFQGESSWVGSGRVSLYYVSGTSTLGIVCAGESWFFNYYGFNYPDICGDLNHFSMSDKVQLVVWRNDHLSLGYGGPPSEDIFTVTPPTPATTLPPDFLAPKTYGNPASVTGTVPALPATPVTPTAPAITASATSVIYNGVPQSAAYSVDQKSSCSTTYNGSAIPPVAAGTYAVSITCSANSLTSTATTTLTITKASPVISWSTPAAITSTTKLGASQLNAFSYIPGSFTYSAASSAIGAGSTLPAGDDLVTATFTPTDSTNYTTSTMTVTIHVTP